MITKKKYETEGLDNYLRLFPKVMRTELTLLQKYILCDVISRNIQGEPYYKVSATLAEELGNYKKKTIQTAFQWLNSNGYINTEPYNDGKHKDDLREVEIIQIEKWIYTDEHLNKIGFKISPTEKKTKDENYAWIMKNRKGKDVSNKKENNLMISKPSDLNNDNLINSPVQEKKELDCQIKTIEDTEAIGNQFNDSKTANAFADSFINKIILNNKEIVKNEIESENHIDNLIDVLDKSTIKFTKKIYIKDDIKNGIIVTIKQLNERLAS